MKIKFLVIALASCLASIRAQAVVDNVTSKFVLGSWTSDIAGARAYAKEKGTYFLHLFANNQGGCGMCNGAANALFNKAVFKEWAKKNDVPLVIGDTISGGAATDAFKNYFSGSIALPVLAVVDGASGNLKIAMDVMHSGVTMKGENVYPKTIGAEAIILGLDPVKFLNPVSGWLGYVLGRTDNLPTFRAGATGTVTSPKMRLITADAMDCEALYVHGMWDGADRGYGTNSLSHVCYAYGTQKCKAHDGDQFDWYQVGNVEARETYRLATPYLRDERNHGYACIFTSKDQVSQIYTNKVFTFDSVTNAAARVIPMESLRTGVTVSTDADMYIVFTRPDVDKMDTVELTYTFTLQKAPSAVFYLAEGDPRPTLSRTNPICPVNVYRSNAGRESEVGITVDYGAYGDDRHDDLQFETELTNLTYEVELPSRYLSDSVWLPTGELSVKLDDLGGELPNGGVLERKIAVLGDKSGNADGTTKDNAHQVPCPDATAAWAKSGERNLNHTVTNDWIAFSSVATGIYRLGADLFAPTDAAVVDATVTVVTNGAAWRSYPLAEVATNAPAFEITDDILANGLENATLLVLVARSSNDTVRLEYELKLRALPKISFEKAETSAEVPSTLSLSVNSSLTSTESFPIAFDWKSLSTNGLATAGVDFEDISTTSNIAANTTVCTIEVPILENQTQYSPERSFLVQLEPSPDYVLGAVSNVVITLAGDKVGNEDGAAADAPHAVPLEGATAAWAKSGERNLNHTVTNDWIAFSSVATGIYRLGADLFAPTDAAVVDATVTVVTNGAAWRSYPLAEVATNAPAFEITDDILANGLENATLLVSVVRSPNDTVRLEYELKLRAWTTPELGASVTALEIDDTNDVVKVTLTRGGETNDTTRIAVRSQDGAALAGWDYKAVDETVTIPAGTNVVDFEVHLIPETNGVWRGDRAFTLTFEAANAELYATNGLVAKTVTLKEVDPEFEAGDSAAESAVAPAVLKEYGDKPLSMTRTLHGSDVNDYFMFSSASNHVCYWFEARSAESNTVNATGLKIRVTYPDGKTEEKPFPAERFEKEMTQDGDVKVHVFRDDTSTEMKPVSVGYVLATGVRPVPRYQLAASAISADDTNATVTVTVLRLDKTDEAGSVCIATSNITAKAGSSAPDAAYVALDKSVEFGAGETSKTLTIRLVPEKTKIYTGDRAFSVYLTLPQGAESKLGNVADCVVTLKDVDAEKDASDPADDDRGTTANRLPMAQTVASTGEHRLNGGDLADWYQFTDVAANCHYRFGLAGDPVLNNCTADEINVSIYADGFTDEAHPTTNVTFAALMGGTMVRLAEKTATATPILVKVWREAKSVPVSVAYNLTFREQPPQTVTLATNRVVVSELADAAFLDVVCGTDGGEALEADVVATLTFADGTGDAGERVATAPTDYDATPIVLSWDAGTMGGTKRVRLPLTNYGTDWKGDRGYRVFLTPDEDTDIAADGINQATVWILEKDTPTYGTVAQTAVNGMALTKTTTLAVREGDEMAVNITLADGISGVVTGEWTIAVGKAKTVVSQELFAAEEPAQTKTFKVAVPETDGFQLSQSGTVTFALKAAAQTVTSAKNAITSFKLTIADKNYAGAVGDIAKEDPTRPAFRAAGSAWFLDPAGAYRAAMPSAGGSVMLTTTVTGPGTLSFTAAIPDGCTLAVKSGGAATLAAQTGANKFAVASGMRTVTFALARARGTTVAADAVASVSDVVFTRAEAANAYGTFVGAVQKDGAEGLGTVTVAANGRMSGKFQFAGATWVFSASGDWDESFQKAVTAKCGGESVRLSLQADAASGQITASSEDATWAATLYRNAWADKPKSAAMVALADAALGYYTVALPEKAGEIGSGYLTLTIGDAGAVKAAGKLADGRSVSLSGVLTEGGIRLFNAPPAYRGGFFAATLTFDAQDQTLGGDGLWISQAAASPFERAVRVAGGWYDKTINLQEHYESGLAVGTIDRVGSYALRGKDYDATAWAASEGIPVSLAFAANGRVTATEGGRADGGARLFSMSVNRATGLFSGYLRAEYDVGGRTIRKATTYRGVLTPVRAEESDPEGRGFFLMNGESYDFTIEGN